MGRYLLLIITSVLIISCGGDCDELMWFRDADGDGFGDSSITEFGCDPIPGFVSNDVDEDDSCSIRDWVIFYQDMDGDGLGNRLVKSFDCMNPDLDSLVDNGFDLNDAIADQSEIDPVINIVIDFLEGFEITDTSILNVLKTDPDPMRDFAQHSTLYADGVDGYLPLFRLFNKQNDILTYNLFRDEDHVVAHISYGGRWNNSVPQVALEVFRIEDGRIAEHWDNIEDFVVVDQTPASIERSPSDVGANEILVRNMIADVFVNEEPTNVELYFNPDFVDHSARPLSFNDLMSAEGNPRYDDIELVFGSDNLILAGVQGVPDDFNRIDTYFDLYVINDGLITERWQTIQLLPSAFLHMNGKW